MKLLKISRKLWKFNLNGLLSSYNETATYRLGKWRDHFGISGSCLSLLTYTRWWNSLITLPRPSNFILRVSCAKQSRKGRGLGRFIECVHESYSKTKPCGKVRAAEGGLGHCWNLALIYSFKAKTRGKNDLLEGNGREPQWWIVVNTPV